MSPRAAHPRSDHQHDLKASQVLRDYQAIDTWTATLPVPVEDIVERMFGLRILVADIEEGDGHTILGALRPEARTITLNERHMELFDRCIGPERFTIAHELGHWLYDADDPAQETLFAAASTEVQFCRDPTATNLPASAAIRERNANRFAARLLLPGDLVRATLDGQVTSSREIAAHAAAWGVSRRTLEIRMAELGLLAE